MTREESLAMFERAAATPVEGHDAEWLWLATQVLGLPGVYIPAVQEALRQGRWRQAKIPRAYVKTVAKREAVRLGLADDPTENLHLTIPNIRSDEGRLLSHDDYIDYLAYDGPVIEGGIWYARNPDSHDEDEFTENGEWLSPRERLLNRIPEELKRVEDLPSGVKTILERLNASLVDDHLSTDPLITPDWQKIALSAGLDEGEAFVLECKLRGISRERAMSEKPEDERTKIQAAWRRFDRSGMEKLRAVLLKDRAA